MMSRKNGRMNRVLRLLALVGGVSTLLFSIYWSQDGFNFDVAGDAGYSQLAVIGGYTLAIVVSIVEFVFSTNFRELNPSLLLFGILAYAYSIWTNKSGILHWQGSHPNDFGSWFLGFCVDGLPEPLIAWALGESLSGDFVGNIWNTAKGLVGSLLDGVPEQHNQPKQNQPEKQREPSFNFETKVHKGEGSNRRHMLESKRNGHPEKEIPNRFGGFGE